MNKLFPATNNTFHLMRQFCLINSGCLEQSFKDSEAMTELSSEEYCNQLVMSATEQMWEWWCSW